ncbi:helicase HerA domain-containing protein [Mycolicibacter virginiensis]|uniref:helicase HerA domain-containing protein n=1 Tax=Mycolicibacter virginiensis TaxID=1795032 RepID=UPI001F03765C|nr:DUF87 domain-containing protein [Mycolicibacter virginiensis]ULP45884.1 DUF87 domain-containing protein [Mycolicibacter virginiensis]
MSEPDNPFAGLKFGGGAGRPAPEPVPEPATEPRTEAPSEPVIDTAAAEESERRLEAAAAEYVQLLPAIQAAQPVRGSVEMPEVLSGTAYAVDAWMRLVADRETVTACGLDGLGTFRVSATAVKDAVFVTVCCENPSAAGTIAQRLIEMAERRGNLGRYTRLSGAGGTFTLARRNVEDPTFGWRESPKTKAFYLGGDYRRGVWDLVGLVQKADRALQYPQCVFGSDERGGSATLTLPPGMLPKQVQAAESGLRQALGMPELTVTIDGLNPVIHLNQKSLVREFPKVNPLKASWFTRPRTQAERHAAAPDFVLPLGVRDDGSPILVNQDQAPHMGIFGGTGAGKTVLLSSIVKAAVLQGAEVVLADAKNGKDFRKLALAGLRGVVSYNAASGGNDAVLHRAIRYARDELERRQALAERLTQRGVEYRPTPLLLVFDEAPAWIHDRSQSSRPKAVKDAAQAAVANLSYLCSQARELRVFVLTAGQFAYVSGFAGDWKVNTSTLVILGPPSEINRQSLFPAGAAGDAVRILGGTITKAMKGRGIAADVETGEVQLFQGFYNLPGRDADAFDAAVAQAPKLRRFAWRFPLPGADGGDGTWQTWTPATDPSSDSLPVVYLDGPDGIRDLGTVVFDPTSEHYKPGSKPLSTAHQHLSSYD